MNILTSMFIGYCLDWGTGWWPYNTKMVDHCPFTVLSTAPSIHHSALVRPTHHYMTIKATDHLCGPFKSLLFILSCTVNRTDPLLAGTKQGLIGWCILVKQIPQVIIYLWIEIGTLVLQITCTTQKGQDKSVFKCHKPDNWPLEPFFVYWCRKIWGITISTAIGVNWRLNYRSLNAFAGLFSDLFDVFMNRNSSLTQIYDFFSFWSI